MCIYIYILCILYIYIYTFIYIYYIYMHTYIYIYKINLQTVAVSLFVSSSVQLTSNEDLDGPGCSNYCQGCDCYILLLDTLLDQQSVQLYKFKECNIRSICRQQLLHSMRAHQYSSDQMKILKDQSAQTNARVLSVAYCLWLPFLINTVLNLTKLRIYMYKDLYIS